MFNFFLGTVVAVLAVGGIVGFVIAFFGLSVHSGRIEELQKANKKLTDYWKRTDDHTVQIKDLQTHTSHLWEEIERKRDLEISYNQRLKTLEKKPDNEAKEIDA